MTTEFPDPDAIVRVLAPLGELASLDVLEGGTFASVWEATFASGEVAIVKIAPPDAAASLLRYEERMLRTEAWAMRLAEERGWPVAGPRTHDGSYLARPAGRRGRRRRNPDRAGRDTRPGA